MKEKMCKVAQYKTINNVIYNKKINMIDFDLHLPGEEAAAGGDPAEEEARGGGQHGQPAHPHPGPNRLTLIGRHGRLTHL